MEWNYLNKSIVDHAKVIYSRNIFFFLFLFSHQMITVENSQTFSSLKRELCQCTEHETWETFKWTWCVFLVPADLKLYSEFQNVQNKMFNFPYERVHHPPTVSIECPLVVTKNTSKISIKWKILAFKDKDRLWMYFFLFDWWKWTKFMWHSVVWISRSLQVNVMPSWVRHISKLLVAFFS